MCRPPYLIKFKSYPSRRHGGVCLLPCAGCQGHETILLKYCVSECEKSKPCLEEIARRTKTPKEHLWTIFWFLGLTTNGF